MEKLKEYLELRQEKESLENLINLIQVEPKEQIKILQEQMKKETKEHSLSLNYLNKRIQETQSDLCNNWPVEGKQAMIDGHTITLKTSAKPDIKDEDGLLREIISMVEPGNALPFRTNWTNKAIVTLIESGVIPSDLALIKEEKHLALSKTVIKE